jgi:hypothetical protein
MWVAVGYSLWSLLCACGSALGLSGSGSCGSGLAGSGDIDHVRVIQPVAGPGRPYAPRGLEPTTNVVFVGTFFRRATNAAGKSGLITGSSYPARFPGCICSTMEKRSRSSYQARFPGCICSTTEKRSHRSSYPARFPGCICSTTEKRSHSVQLFFTQTSPQTCTFEKCTPPAFPDSSTPSLPSLTVTQRVHSPHLPSSLRPHITGNLLLREVNVPGQEHFVARTHSPKILSVSCDRPYPALQCEAPFEASLRSSVLRPPSEIHVKIAILLPVLFLYAPRTEY